MKPQLHMWSGTRRSLLERHDFYVAQVQARVLAPFNDIEGEAKRHADAEFERLGRVVDPERWDGADVAEVAMDRGQERYTLLSDLRMQMWLGALAGLYHQWDKDLRGFLEHELTHYYPREAVVALVWGPAEVRALFDLLRDDFDWDCTAEPFSADIEACRLIVNVHKHGKGRSLRQLAEAHPEFLRRAFAALPKWSGDWLDHDWLQITEEQFTRVAGCLRAFWVAFPERSFLAED